MRAPVMLMLFLSCVAALAQGTGRPSGKNCGLAVPPANAGEEHNHGMIFRIYPRARDIGPTYTGCQMVWMPQDNNKWLVLTITEIKLGDAVRIWSPEASDPVRFSCTYRKGQVIKGDAANCAIPESLIVKSVAPGCMEKIFQAVARGGIAAASPAGCEYD
jgi:hypothetical protein